MLKVDRKKSKNIFCTKLNDNETIFGGESHAIFEKYDDIDNTTGANSNEHDDNNANDNMNVVGAEKYAIDAI